MTAPPEVDSEPGKGPASCSQPSLASTNTASISYDTDSDLTTDLVEVALPSYHNEDGYLWVIQDDPLPMTLLALSPEVKMGER